MNDIGDLLAPGVLVLLIGERPGLGTAASLSAYMAYRPASAVSLLRRNVAIYGLGGIIVPFIGIKLIDLLITALGA